MVNGEIIGADYTKEKEKKESFIHSPPLSENEQITDKLNYNNQIW